MKKLSVEDLQRDLKKIVEIQREIKKYVGELEFRIQMNEMQITGIKKQLEKNDNMIDVVNKDLTI